MCWFSKHIRSFIGWCINVVVMLALLLFTASYVHALPAISIGDGVSNGSSVSFPLSLSGSQGSAISTMRLDIKFDAEKLALKNPDGILASAVAGKVLIDAGKTVTQNALAEGVLRLVIADKVFIANQGGGSALNDGVIATVSFDTSIGFDQSQTAFSILPEAASLLGKPLAMAPRFTGDILGRGQLPQLRDSLLILKSVVGAYNITPEQHGYADMNGDGNVDVGDAILILAKVVGL